MVEYPAPWPQEVYERPLRPFLCALSACVQTQYRASRTCSIQEHDLHKARWDSLFRWPSRLFPTRVPLLCKWYAAFRSFRGRIRIQSAKEGERVHPEPSVQFRDGRYQANTRKLAHAEGIERLRAIHRWVDIVDLHKLLRGFEAGEGYNNTDCLRLDSSTPCNVYARTD